MYIEDFDMALELSKTLIGVYFKVITVINKLYFTMKLHCFKTTDSDKHDNIINRIFTMYIGAIDLLRMVKSLSIQCEHNV